MSQAAAATAATETAPAAATTAAAPTAPKPKPELAAVPAKPVKQHRAFERQIERMEFTNTTWRHLVDPGVPYQQLLAPEYWAHVAGPKNMKIGDFIVVESGDNSYVAKLYVIDVGAVWANVVEIWKKELTTQLSAGDDVATAGFELRWNRQQRHHVVRLKDNQVMEQGFATKAEAHTAMLSLAQRARR